MKRFTYYLVIALVALLVVGLAFYAADYVSNNGAAQEVVNRFGLVGIIIVAFISGLNIIVPIHAAAFAPVFIEAGYSFLTIIFAFSIGTLTADLLAYALGTWGRHTAETKNPRFHAKLIAFNEKHSKLIFPGVLLYAALVPLPNEVLLIPLGLIGFRLYFLLPPLVVGTIFNHSLFTFGAVNIFEILF